MTATTPTKPASAQGTVADPTSFIWTDDLHTALEAIGVPVRKVRMTELLLLWRGLTSAAQFAAAPEPAASSPSPGEVERLARDWVENGRTDNFGKPDPGDWDHIRLSKPFAYSQAMRIAAWAITANSKAGDEDVRGALADLQERFNQLHTIKDIHAEKRHEAETTLEKAVAEERKACARVRPEKPETFHYQADGYAFGWHAAISAFRAAIRARTLATPETEPSHDG